MGDNVRKCFMRLKEKELGRAFLREVFFTLDASGALDDVNEAEVVRSVIRSRAQLTYDQADACLEGAPDHGVRPAPSTVVLLLIHVV